ncbi:MAG: phosphoribosyltransferase family protein [Candidatus Peribacteraceae bacterium]|nr:phosphoribosyltransferase family protein [Candidatus Peribacteraceae bacterium]MDD5074550.1 phosphoribosyltransferase family protein [Candidatus Peribacteraceae bacterium]
MHEKCGVAGIADLRGEENVVPDAAALNLRLIHRGELGGGLSGVTDGALWTVKGNDTEECTAPRADLLAGRRSTSAIAHRRYATSGERSEIGAQPFQNDDFSFGFNGTIANYASLAARLRERRVALGTNVDTEIIQQLIVEGIRLAGRGDMRRVFRSLENELDGSYTVTLLGKDGDLYGYRNKLGNRPLSYAVIGGRIVVMASENSAIEDIYPGARTHDVGPGQLLIAKDGKCELQDVMREGPEARCFFEWTYFARRRSTIDGMPVAGARDAWGRQLARMERLKPDGAIVVPIPDSAETAAHGYADESRCPLVMGIEKVREGRTFIEGHPVVREEKARLKYKLHPELLGGRKVILVDDSLVRGTTMTALVKRLRAEGHVSEIHVRIACPPILAPCFYGIDFPEIKELIARLNFSGVLTSGELPEEVLTLIAARLGVDSIRFLPVESVPQVLSRHCHGLCMACVTGEYPTHAGRVLHQVEERKVRAQ